MRNDWKEETEKFHGELGMKAKYVALKSIEKCVLRGG